MNKILKSNTAEKYKHSTILAFFILLTVFCTPCLANNATHFNGYCNIESLLGYYSDPDFKGKVKHYTIAKEEYGANKKLSGDSAKFEFFFTTEGELTKSNNQTIVLDDKKNVVSYHNLTIENSKEKSLVCQSGLANGEKYDSCYTYVHIFDERGNIIKDDLYTKNKLVRTEETFIYNSNGQLESKLNSLGQLSLYTYDHSGNEIYEKMSNIAAPTEPFFIFIKIYNRQNRLDFELEYDVPENSFTATKYKYTETGSLHTKESYGLQLAETIIYNPGYIQILEYGNNNALVSLTAQEPHGGYTKNSYKYDKNNNLIAITRDRHIQYPHEPMVNLTEYITFINDSHGNWIKGTFDSDKNRHTITRTIEYY